MWLSFYIQTFSLQEALEPLCRLPFKEIRKLLSLVEKQIDWESLEVQVQFNFHSEVSLQVYEYFGLLASFWKYVWLKNEVYSQYDCPLGVSGYVSAFLSNAYLLFQMACEVEKNGFRWKL